MEQTRQHWRIPHNAPRDPKTRDARLFALVLVCPGARATRSGRGGPSAPATSTFALSLYGSGRGPHRVGRRRAGRPEHLLRRRGLRRRLEDPPMAARTWAPIFDDQPVPAIGALAVVAVEPEHRLGRHRRSLGHPRHRHDGRRHLQVHRRRRDLDAHGPRRDRPHRPHRRSIPPTRTSSTCARWAAARARSRSAASIAPPTAARRWKRVLFVDPEHRLLRPRRWTRTIPNTLFAGMWQVEMHT